MQKFKTRSRNRGEGNISNRTAKERLDQSKRDKSMAGGGRGRGRAAATGAPRRRIRGQGDYFTDAHNWLKKNVPKGTFSGMGGAAGGALASEFGPVGTLAGGTAGSFLGDQLASLVGFGDYDIKYNSLLDPAAAKAVSAGSSFSSPTSGAKVIISHRECLGNYNAPVIPAEATSTFHSKIYRIQPTNEIVFPWLNTIAGNYVEYRIHGLIFSYETTSSNYSATMGLGTVTLATQHNANCLPYTGMTQMLNVENMATGNPARDIVHGVECDPAEQTQIRLFTRRNGTAGDPNLYDFGVFTVSSEGLPPAASGVGIGKLFVTYQIELDEAALPPNTPSSGKVAAFSNLSYVNSVTTALWGPTSEVIKPAVTYWNHKFLMSVGSGLTDNIRLLPDNLGPYRFPDNTAVDKDMCFWLSKDSGSTTGLNFIGFRYPGYYNVTSQFGNCGTQNLTLSRHGLVELEGHEGTIVKYVGTAYACPEATADSNVQMSIHKVYIPGGGGSIAGFVSGCSTYGASCDITIAIEECLPWSDEVGHDESSEVLKLREALVEQNGCWVETKVFVPEDNFPTAK